MDESAKFRLLTEAAERPEYDEVCDRLARGELSKAEEMALRTSEDPEIRRIYELFRPLDAQAKSRFDAAVQQAFPALAQRTANRSWWARHSPARRWAMIGGPTLAAAAAVLLIVVPPREPAVASPLLADSLEPLVDHAAAGSWLGTNHPPGTTFQLLPDICWHLRLGVAPSGRLPKPSSVHAYFVQANSVVAWDVAWRVQKNDSLVPVDDCKKLPVLAAGSWELLVLSGRDAPSVDPKEAAAACRKGPPAGAGWRCDHYAVQILPAPSSL